MIPQFTGQTVNVETSSDAWSTSANSDIALYDDSFDATDHHEVSLHTDRAHASMVFSEEEDDGVEAGDQSDSSGKASGTNNIPGEFLTTMLNYSESNSVASDTRPDGNTNRSSLHMTMARADPASFDEKEMSVKKESYGMLSTMMLFLCMPRTPPKDTEQGWSASNASKIQTNQEDLHARQHEASTADADALDSLCNHVESFVCRDDGSNVVDQRHQGISTGAPATARREKDTLDSVFEQMEAIACRDDNEETCVHPTSKLETSNGSRATPTPVPTPTVDLLDNICEHMEYTVCRKPADYPVYGSHRGIYGPYVKNLNSTGIPVYQFHEGSRTHSADARKWRDKRSIPAPNADMLDYVFENVETFICHEDYRKRTQPL